MENRICAEWSKARAVWLAHPASTDQYNTKAMRAFYDFFIKMLAQDIPVRVIVQDRSLIENSYPNNVEFIEAHDLKEIWIRDWAPQQLCVGEQCTVVPFQYRPRYLKPWKQKSIPHERIVAKILAPRLQNTVLETIPFKLDGGNLITNGEGIGITTERARTDNPGQDMAKILEDIGIRELIIIEEEPGDFTGHIDGLMRFVDHKTLVVNAYPQTQHELYNYIHRQIENIQKRLGNRIKIVLMPSRLAPFDSESYKMYLPEKYYSHYTVGGNYINYLRIENRIYLPYYGIAEDKKARAQIEQAAPEIEVIPVTNPGILEVNKNGGVLNCITWVEYE